MLGIFLDTETNGLNPKKHKILEIALQIVDVFTGKIIDSFESQLSISTQDWKDSDPSSLNVNGFTWEQTCKGSSPIAVAKLIYELFEKNEVKRGEAVFICQNPSFDRAFFGQLIDPDEQEALLWPYHWLDLASMYWAETIRKGKEGTQNYPWETGCSKDTIAIAYHLPAEEKPHRAINGVKHLILCYETVVGFPGKFKGQAG